MTEKVEGNFCTMTTGDYTQDGINVWTNGSMYLIFDPENKAIYFTNDKDNPVNRCTMSYSGFRVIEQIDEGCYFSVNDAMLSEICNDGIWDFSIKFEVLSNVEVGHSTAEGETIGNTTFTGTVHESICYGSDGKHMYFIKDKNGVPGAFITYDNDVWGLITPADGSEIWYQNESDTVFGEYTPTYDWMLGKVIITPLS
jgi:hypothetical protein